MRKRILLVDDEPAVTRMIKLNLEQTGRYEVRTENRGANAIAAARDFRPDLIVLDVMMPDMSGSEISEQLQEDPQLCAIKFIFLTALVSKDQEQWSDGKIGGHTFVAKPVSADKLCQIIETALAPAKPT
jgi:CheY-like chemotaxis protein